MYQAFTDFITQDENYWKLNVFLIVLGTAAVSFVAGLVLSHLQKQLKRTETVWDDAALNAAGAPLRALIWVLGINIASHMIALHSSAEIFRYASMVREVVVIFIFAWFLMRFVRNMEQELLNPPPGKAAVDVTSAHAISKLVRISIGITAFLILLEKLGYSIAGVMAFGGIGGIAVGFAAKDLLANFFGGLMIFLDRPFSIGDWVRSPDREIEGIVEHIGWRQTRIRTLDKRPLYVPNSMFASIAVENPSRMTHRRIRETLGLRYEDWSKMGVITEKVRFFLESHEHIDKSQGITVSFTLCNASSLDFLVNAFTRTTDGAEFSGIKQEILLGIMTIVRSEGAEFAFPTQTLHMSAAHDTAPTRSPS
jgi:MscS family membrane protein